MDIILKRTNKKIKELHGVGNGPCTGTFNIDKTEEFKAARIPFSRTHDTEGSYGSGEFINIHCIFPNFDADVNNPESYNFACTDLYLKYILKAGTKIFYRLGETIENKSDLVARYIHPPKDMKKWAEICEHIIMHYNEGWADGYHMDIEYWEIWNEPDNKHMWTGTNEQFYELYSITANHLKKRFPNIKIGGYSATGFYTAISDPYAGNWLDDWFRNLISYAHDFLKYITNEKTKAPLDFFSWHFYSDNTDDLAKISDYVRNLLDSYGFYNSESILNEWNYNNLKNGGNTTGDFRKSMECAAYVSAMLTTMQKKPVDLAMYYDAEVKRISYCGLFSAGKKKPEKPYYCFLAYKALIDCVYEADCGIEDKNGIYSLSAADDNEAALIITNFNADNKEIVINTDNLKNKSVAEMYILNETSDLNLCDIINVKDNKFTINSEKNSVLLIKIK